jgi:hypothetical protein
MIERTLLFFINSSASNTESVAVKEMMCAGFCWMQFLTVAIGLSLQKTVNIDKFTIAALALLMKISGKPDIVNALAGGADTVSAAAGLALAGLSY